MRRGKPRPLLTAIFSLLLGGFCLCFAISVSKYDRAGTGGAATPDSLYLERVWIGVAAAILGIALVVAIIRARKKR